MKILSKLTILILLVLAFVSIFPQNGHAKCDEKEIEASIKTTARNKTQEAFSALRTYNAAVNAYENSCGRIANKGNPSHYPTNALRSLLILDQSLGATASASANFENTGISWQAINPTRSECQTLAKKAAQAQENYNKLRGESIMALGVAAKDSEIPTSCVCPENSSEQQCVSYVQSDKETKSDDGCESFPTYLASFSSCPLCPIFQTILDTNNRVATIAWDTMAKALQATVQIFFSVFLAIETLKIIANFSGAGLSGYLRSVFGLGLKVFIAYYLLSNSQYIYGMFISPVIKGGLDMGVTLMSSASNEASACFSTTSELSTSSSGVLDATLLNGIMSAVRCFGTSAAIMPAIGRGLICHSWVPGEAIIPDFSMLISGVLFLLTGIAIWLVVSFYLIDCTVQLGLVCTLVPFCIACWPFRVSQTYTFKGLRLLMNSFFNYVMVGIIMLIGAAITSSAVGSENGDMQTMIIAFNEDNLEMIKKLASLDSLALLVLVVCCVFAFRLIEKANNIAEKFSQGSGSNIGAKLGGVVAGVGKKLAQTGLKAAEKLATAPADAYVAGQKIAIVAATGGAAGGGAAAGGAEAGAAGGGAEAGAAGGGGASAGAGGAEAGGGAGGGAGGEGAADQATRDDIDTDKVKDQMDNNDSSGGDDEKSEDDEDYALTSSADNPIDALVADGADTSDFNNEGGNNPAADAEKDDKDNSILGAAKDTASSSGTGGLGSSKEQVSNFVKSDSSKQAESSTYGSMNSTGSGGGNSIVGAATAAGGAVTSSDAGSGGTPSGGTGGEMPSGGNMPSGGSGGGGTPSGGSGGNMPSGGSGGNMPSGGSGGNMPSGGNTSSVNATGSGETTPSEKKQSKAHSDMIYIDKDNYTEYRTDEAGNKTTRKRVDGRTISIRDGVNGNKDVMEFDKDNNLEREYHKDQNNMVERQYYTNGQLKFERTNDANGNGHYHAYKEDGSEDFKSEWKNDAQMAAQFKDD